jgi:hypothetical protein
MQEDCKFKECHGYIWRTCVKKNVEEKLKRRGRNPATQRKNSPESKRTRKWLPEHRGESW